VKAYEGVDLEHRLFLMWTLAPLTLVEKGDSGHTFHFLIFYIFSVLAKTNIRAQLGSSILGLQSELYIFRPVYKEVEREAFSLTSAYVPTCPSYG
jgi:hypothetical protein